MIVPLLISGKELKDNQDLIFEVESPFVKGDILYETQGASEENVQEAIKSSANAYSIWKKSTYLERRKLLIKVAEVLDNKRKYFSELLSQMGMPEWFINFNIDSSLSLLEELASCISESKGIIPQNSNNNYSLVVDCPLGCILSIAPWNAPIFLTLRSIAGPVAAGCSVILKTSEQSSLIQFELAKIFCNCTAVSGLVNTINHRPSDASKITEKLISDRFVKKVTFTGSTDVGKIIASVAGKYLKPVVLELGGKSAAIVLSDADLKKAARSIVFGGFAHNGQICMSTERVYVIEDIYDEFLEYLLNEAKKYTLDNKIFPQRATRYAKKVEELLNNAVEAGSKIIFGGINRNNAFLQPTILTNVPMDSDLYDNETFGPTFFIQKVKEVEEATSLLNSSKYGLSSSLWTTNILEAIRIADEIECGAVHINGCTIHDEPLSPHGGVKESGFGRSNSKWSINEFKYLKTITIGKD